MAGDGAGVGVEQAEAPDAGEVTDEATVYEAVKLERTVGLAGALSIGVGTMVGAGIFVFSGLANGAASPVVAVSVALGGVVALLVAVRVLEGEQVPATLVDALPGTEVFLLGYHVVHEQTAPGQARAQFADRVESELADAGVAPGRVDATVVVAVAPLAAIAERVATADLVVIGESDGDGGGDGDEDEPSPAVDGAT